MLDAIERRYLPRALGAARGELLTWARYVALHEAIRVPLIGAHRLTSLVTRVAARRATPARDRQLEHAVRERYWQLLARDFDGARRGLYPRELLFDVPLASYAASLPRFLRDTPRVLGRMGAGAHDDLPPHVDLSAFPAYYRRTFHWQTDGYLSRRSAALYDLGVELLFIGAADVMRRQVLAEVVRRKRPGALRLLDVATGTGRFLGQAARALPGSTLVGVDLSPWYIEHAREHQRARGGASRSLRFEVGNAESLPFADESFDAVTSIFLLHELPRRVRRTALAEVRRVLAPGGLLVLEDAAQSSDAHELAPVLAQFSKDMHEPYFADYQRDDLAALLEEAGFSDVRVGSHFVAKVASANKPHRPAKATRTQSQTQGASGVEDLAHEREGLLH